MSNEIVRKGWKLVSLAPSWTFRHESGFEVRTSEEPKEIRPYKLFAPDGNPVNVVPYNRGFVKRCQAMAMAEFFARNPFIFESLQNHAKQISRCNDLHPCQPAGSDPLAVDRSGEPGQATPGSRA